MQMRRIPSCLMICPLADLYSSLLGPDTIGKSDIVAEGMTVAAVPLSIVIVRRLLPVSRV